ncbi:hypothetical protein RAS2_27930 [Phycisphaerae bacterium RAS2]|nr:hypothetical protein RAS2_27930 [Phycisphaerae bacterium RAS2]
MESNRDKLIESLRKEINAAHQEAIAALEKISTFVSRDVGLSVEVTAPAASRRTRKPVPVLSNRDTVMKAIAREFKSVTQIANETGLEKAQVRAVVYEKKLADMLERRNKGGALEFRRHSGLLIGS